MVVICGGLVMVVGTVTKPVFCPIVAAAELVELQKHCFVTFRGGELSLNAPIATICRVPPGARVTPVGPIVMLVTVGVVKNPRQLTPKASAIRTVKASVNASLRPVNININDRLE
jgi:hypothetical protein